MDIAGKFRKSASYRISVAGHLEEAWQGRLGDLQIVDSTDKSCTVLEGRVRDQAELAGVLQTLHDLQLPLLGVQQLAEP